MDDNTGSKVDAAQIIRRIGSEDAQTRAFQRGMSVALSQFDHPSLVGPLLDMSFGEREYIEPALTRLLPQDPALLHNSR